jgi:hypothetical protein
MSTAMTTATFSTARIAEWRRRTVLPGACHVPNLCRNLPRLGTDATTDVDEEARRGRVRIFSRLGTTGSMLEILALLERTHPLARALSSLGRQGRQGAFRNSRR